MEKEKQTLLLESHAKINIGLDILRRREDGFHELSSIFQEIRWGDQIHLSKADKGIHFTCDNPGLENDDNLCVHAARKLLNENEAGIRIHLEKQIPMGAGLGGGSSNAAAVLVAVNSLYNMRLTKKNLADIGAQIGSDIPFFIYGKTALVKGRGEVITPISNISPLRKVFLVIPDIHLSTKLMYAKLKNFLTKEKKSLIIHGSFTENVLDSDLAGLKNDFEEIAMQMHPELREIKKAILDSGCSTAMMTGSGSAFFGLYENAIRESRFLKKYRLVNTEVVT